MCFDGVANSASFHSAGLNVLYFAQFCGEAAEFSLLRFARFCDVTGELA